MRFALSEKRLDWTGHYIDILAGEQFKPEFLAINPKAVVPVLVHDGQIIPESTVICEYMEDAFPDHPIYPSSPAPGPVSMPVSSSGCRSRLVTRCAPMEFAPGRTSRGCLTSERWHRLDGTGRAYSSAEIRGKIVLWEGTGNTPESHLTNYSGSLIQDATQTDCVDSGNGAAMKGQNGEATVCRINTDITKLRNTTEKHGGFEPPVSCAKKWSASASERR